MPWLKRDIPIEPLSQLGKEIFRNVRIKREARRKLNKNRPELPAKFSRLPQKTVKNFLHVYEPAVMRHRLGRFHGKPKIIRNRRRPFRIRSRLVRAVERRVNLNRRQTPGIPCKVRPLYLKPLGVFLGHCPSGTPNQDIVF